MKTLQLIPQLSWRRELIVARSPPRRLLPPFSLSPYNLSHIVNLLLLWAPHDVSVGRHLLKLASFFEVVYCFKNILVILKNMQLLPIPMLKGYKGWTWQKNYSKLHVYQMSTIVCKWMCLKMVNSQIESMLFKPKKPLSFVQFIPWYLMKCLLCVW